MADGPACRLGRSLCRFAVALALVLGWGLRAGAQSTGGTVLSTDECLACHQDPSLTGRGGRPVVVDPAAYPQSVHGRAGLACTDCHADLSAPVELPHGTPLAQVRCETCHEEAGVAYGRSAHAAAKLRAPDSPAPTCADCHGSHDIRSAQDPASRTYPLTLPATCGRCHGDPDIIRRAPIEIGDVFTAYRDSIHGQALTRAGLLVAANCSHCHAGNERAAVCTDCHGSHDIRRRTDPASPVHRTNIARTCGACHAGIAAQFERGIHGRAGREGRQRAPVCPDCHTAHEIRRVDAPDWQLDAIRECGSCHRPQIRTYRDTFHGQVTALGFVRTATCAQCHGAHEIYPSEDPRSTVSAERRVATCRTCHRSATARFAQYDPHADRHNRARNPALYYAGLVMDGLLAVVFAFWGVHLLLWLSRGWMLRRRASAPAAAKTPTAPPEQPAAPASPSSSEDDS